MADKNTADIGFEKQIWNAACVLRGNMDASEYKTVVDLRTSIRNLSLKETALRRTGTSILPRGFSLFLPARGGVRLPQRHTRRKSVL